MRSYPAQRLVSFLFCVCLFEGLGSAQNADDVWMPEMVFDPKIVIEVEHTGPELLKVDEIEVNLLGDINEKSTDHTLIGSYKVLATKMVRGQDALDIAEGWRILPRSPLVMMMCHNPAYGLRFRLRGKVILETTVCWHCNTYDWVPVDPALSKHGTLEWGFDGESQYAQKLLKLLKTQVPFQSGNRKSSAAK